MLAQIRSSCFYKRKEDTRITSASSQTEAQAEIETPPPAETTSASETPNSMLPKNVTQTFLQRFTTGVYGSAAQMLSPSGERHVRHSVPTAFGDAFAQAKPAVQRLWLGLTSQHGTFEQVTDLSVTGSENQVIASLQSQERTRDLRFDVNNEGSIQRSQLPHPTSLGLTTSLVP